MNDFGGTLGGPSSFLTYTTAKITASSSSASRGCACRARRRSPPAFPRSPCAETFRHGFADLTSLSCSGAWQIYQPDGVIPIDPTQGSHESHRRQHPAIPDALRRITVSVELLCEQLLHQFSIAHLYQSGRCPARPDDLIEAAIGLRPVSPTRTVRSRQPRRRLRT
jgi:hypothetical protein